jgi:hypothetical protein
MHYTGLIYRVPLDAELYLDICYYNPSVTDSLLWITVVSTIMFKFTEISCRQILSKLSVNFNPLKPNDL